MKLHFSLRFAIPHLVQIESANHLCIQCPFAREMWMLFTQDYPNIHSIAEQASSIGGWWNDLTKKATFKERKWEITVAMYIVWNIWKERNRRIFEGKKRLRC